jgi:hypothetical protein
MCLTREKSTHSSEASVEGASWKSWEDPTRERWWNSWKQQIDGLMAKMMSKINGLAHPKKIVTEATTNIDDDSVALQITMVLAKFRLASAVTMVATIATIMAEASNEQRSDNRDAPSSSRKNNRPRYPRPYNMSPEEILNGPCQMHFSYSPKGGDNRVTSKRTVERFRLCEGSWRTRKPKQSTGDKRKDQGARCMYHDHHHQQLPMETNVSCITGPPNTNGEFTQTRGEVTMIQKGRSSKGSQKLITRKVNMPVLAPPRTIEYLNWSGQPI